MNKWLACALVALTSGCPDIKTDPNETSADPIVEFDPSRSIVPFPNNLLISQTTGKVTIPPGCNESAASKGTRELVLNQLDGFGTFETAMSVTLTKPIDASSVVDNILLFKVTADPSTSTAIPVVVRVGTSIRYANQTKNDDNGDGVTDSLTCDTPNPIDSIAIIPRIPLDQKSTYIVALKTGIKTADGEDYSPSFTWSLVRQAENPVTVDDAGKVVSDRTPLDPSTKTGLDSLLGINLLWNAHAPVLAFLEAKGVDRNDVLLGWSFKTQTVQDALDRTVMGTPLTQLLDEPIRGQLNQMAPFSVGLGVAQARAANAFPYEVCDGVEPSDIQCFLKIQLGGGGACADATACGNALTAGTGACALLGCVNVADVQLATIKSPQFQVNRPNSLDPTKPIPGPWADPVKPAKVEDETLNAFIFIPTGTQPAGGWPTAIFQHGLGQSNTNIFAIGGSLARDPDGAGALTGIASIAINAVAHGDRLVKISNSGTCATMPDASCFAGFLSPDLGTTRDNIRQTVVDHNQLIASLKKCTGGLNNCGAFIVDATHLVYIGQSLGGIVGGVTTASSTDIKASVLNVPGVGWADIFENTETLAIRCTLVDGLIDGGILMGEKSNLKVMPPTGLCTTDAWKTQPGYAQFSAIGRWVLDPADPANFVQRLVGGMPSRKFLLQMVVGDTVVPNLATQNEAALTGRTAVPARMNGAPPLAPTDTITAPMPVSKFVTYANLPPIAPSFPGNTFSHGSLLSPAASVNGGTCNPVTAPQFCDGVLGTQQMVIDAITYLQLNK